MMSFRVYLAAAAWANVHQVTKKARMAALKAVGDFVKRLKGTPHVDRYAMRFEVSQSFIVSARVEGIAAAVSAGAPEVVRSFREKLTVAEFAASRSRRSRSSNSGGGNTGNNNCGCLYSLLVDIFCDAYIQNSQLQIAGCLLSIRIKDGVWAVFSKETMTDEVKSRALRPLRELFKLRPPSLAADRWDVSSALFCNREKEEPSAKGYHNYSTNLFGSRNSHQSFGYR